MGSSVTLTKGELLFTGTKNSFDLKYSLLKVSQYKNYPAPGKPALNQVVLRPVVEEQFKASFINLLWSCSQVCQVK